MLSPLCPMLLMANDVSCHRRPLAASNSNCGKCNYLQHFTQTSAVSHPIGACIPHRGKDLFGKKSHYMHTVRQSSSPWRQRESISAELHEWSLTTLCCKYAHVYGALTATGMQNGVPGVRGRVQWFACVCLWALLWCVHTGIYGRAWISWAYIGFLWLRRHKQLKQSQMITLITHEHRKLERKEREGGGGVERRQREWRGVLRMRMCARVCVGVLKWAVKFCH